jgi:hypothetical protein
MVVKRPFEDLVEPRTRSATGVWWSSMDKALRAGVERVFSERVEV